MLRTFRTSHPSSQSDTDGSHHMIAQHYRRRCNRTTEQRAASPIIHLKRLHSWIKEVLIKMHVQKGNVVLDMACGKGGDLAKWNRAEVRLYVGVDIVETSLQEAKKRYQELPTHPKTNACARPANNGARGAFAVKFLCADCFSNTLPMQVRANLAPEAGFDICSCQFALHYSWSTVQRARDALSNVAALLKPGGYFIGTIPDSDVILGKLRRAGGEFGNKLYRIKFDRYQQERALRSASNPYGLQYEFHLEDAVDHCPEWLVVFDELKRLALQNGLELLLKKNFHEFVREHMQVPGLIELMHTLDDTRGNISHEEWECASIYLVFAFRKRPF